MALSFEEGNEKALSFFYHELYPALAHFSYQLTQNRPLAEDIASEAFVKAWRMHYKLNSYAGIKAYLYKIVHRDTMDAITKEQQRTKMYRILPGQTDTDTPFDKLVRSEVYGLIHAALKQLTPASRKVMLMHYIDGMSTGQIARELKLHPSTIKTQKMQGLKALKKVLVTPVWGLLCFCFKTFMGF